MSAMRLVSHNITALKAVAMVPAGLLSLVAGARCVQGSGCGEIVSTMENRVARGSVHISCGAKAQTVPVGALRKAFDGCQWAWHNGTGYLLPAGTVLVTHGAEKGEGRGLERGPQRSPGKPLFSLAVSHADSPSTAWVTVPGVSLSSMAGIAADRNGMKIAANSAGAQVVWDGRRKQVLAVLWRSGVAHALTNLSSSEALGITAIEVDRPAVVMVRQSSSCGSFTVTAADPSNDARGGQLTVRLSGVSGATVCSVEPCPCNTEGETTTVRVALPGGWAAGRSTNATCIPHACGRAARLGGANEALSGSTRTGDRDATTSSSDRVVRGGVPCNPKATPPERCPGGGLCPHCGAAVCMCPGHANHTCPKPPSTAAPDPWPPVKPVGACANLTGEWRDSHDKMWHVRITEQIVHTAPWSSCSLYARAISTSGGGPAGPWTHALGSFKPGAQRRHTYRHIPLSASRATDRSQGPGTMPAHRSR